MAASRERDPPARLGKFSCSLPRLERIGNRLRTDPRLLTERSELERRPRPAARPARALDRIRRISVQTKCEQAGASPLMTPIASFPSSTARQQTTSRPPVSPGSASARARAPSGLCAASKISGGSPGTS